jgi:3-oxoacyl-[acyl-carrier-protein] synthase III
MIGARIRGIAAAVPDTYVDGAHFAALYGQEVISKIDQMAGLARRPRLAPKNRPIDLALTACRSVLERSATRPDDVDTVIYVTQTPEFILPASACILQDELSIPRESAAFDVNLGCSGYVYGLLVASSLIRSGARRRVLLVAGDCVSRICNERDRSTAPLFGDAMTATIVEATDPSGADAIGPFELATDGKGWSHLIVAQGQQAYPSAEQFAAARRPELEAIQDPAHLFMNGDEVFSFAVTRIPKLLNTLLAKANTTADKVDLFVFHQANRFMLEQVRKKLKLDVEKMPLSLQEFGNTSSASIPITLCHRLGGGMTDPVTAALVGFGVGWSYGATLVRLDPGTISPVVEMASAR